MSMITTKNENGVLTLCVHGRIDSSSASDAESEIDAVCSSVGHEAVVLDVEDVEYISSAGLRVVLRLRKSEPTLKVVGASSEVYDIFEMTGFTEMIPVEKGYRRLTVDGCDVIGRGAKGTVYRYNADTIVKVYKNPDSLPDIKNERELARRAFVLGVPTAISYDIVKVGESYGSVFELLDAKSFSQLIALYPEKIDEYVKIYADLLRQIHSTIVKPGDMPDIKLTVRKWCDAVRPYLPSDESAKIDALVDAVPDTMNMLHCDYHTNNVMMQGSEAIIIDMDTLSHGHPVFELANIYITYIGFGEVDPSIVENFIGLDYKTSTEIWNRFLPIYLGTTDKARINEVEEKVKLLNYVRLLRHTVRRGINTEADEKTVALCKEQISELIKKTDTLTY